MYTVFVPKTGNPAGRTAYLGGHIYQDIHPGGYSGRHITRDIPTLGDLFWA